VAGGPVITLLTDFGTADSYVAEVKAVLLDRAPGVTLVDVTHEVAAGDILAGQYLLARAWHWFPAGTVHFVVVDPGVGSPRRALAARRAGHGFVGPDNGLLSPVLEGATVVALPVPPEAAPTFHGRDVFAPAAAALATGAALESLGPAVPDPVRRPPPAPEERDGALLGMVVHVDRFGTLVTNLPADRLPADAHVEIGGRDAGPLRRIFADVPPGRLVALIGSGGTIEVAVRDGSAARTLGAAIGTPVRALRR
jgi:S-adenosylmethionine hydrolase